MDDVHRLYEDEAVPIAGGTVACMKAPSDEQVIFVPTDEVGTPGQLSDHVMGLLGSQRRLRPKATFLLKGYAILRHEQRIICFVVTIKGGHKPADLLSKNLEKALSSAEIRSASSVWLPLLGTGDAGLSLIESFDISMVALKEAGRLLEGGLTTIIALPGPGQADDDDLRALLAHVRAGRTGRADRWGAGATASEVLSLSFFLGRKIGQVELTTELILFGLMQAGSSPGAMRTSDRFACAFNTAILGLSGSRHMDGWNSLFGDTGVVGVFADGRQFESATTRASLILAAALERAKGYGRDSFSVEDLVFSLLEGEGQYRIYLKRMQVGLNDLSDAFSEIVSGHVKMRLCNDSASSEDLLGYSVYASAIAGFVLHAETPVPLSVSIQAPWGAGKSSLMKMIRDQLDPEDRRKAADYVASIGLALSDVLKILKKRMGGMKESVDDSNSGEEKGISTVWFNAWKYESGEQLWAGMVDAIISQLAARMPLAEREAFYLRLHLSRMDAGVIRRKVYNRLLESALSVMVWLIPMVIIASITLMIGQSVFASMLLKFLGGVGLVTGVVAVFRWFWKKTESAKFSLAPYLSIPDYSRSLGSIHLMDEDLDRVMRSAQAAQGQSGKVVVFIDDLDRCSPSKVSSVVEGISMLLASDSYRCVFVVGMDPQVVAASLDCAHKEIRDCLPSYERRVPLGWRFMDKFVQLPFTIPPQANTDRYISSISGVVVLPAGDEQSDVGAGKARPAVESLESRAGGAKVDGSISSKEVSVQASEPSAVAASVPTLDSKDVERIMRSVVAFGVVNPREIKRMANMARLYLALRNERRKLDHFWVAPSLESYAIWIVMAIRWPDFVRWLQWGGSHDASVAGQAEESSIVSKRIADIEKISRESDDFANWHGTVAALLDPAASVKASEDVVGSARIDVGGMDWRSDPAFFHFMKRCIRPQRLDSMSKSLKNGFW
ncbi:KAP family P-loop NTPase fold protein [Stenotrophomonas maltophilia]|uniref:KAP family P-loop NTPase fold protein n=1 Tax=Stenotrophomonas maltophilia TaxID=40324 RepID=UPI003D7D37F4